MLGLGNTYDLIPLIAPKDLQASTPGSKLFSLRDCHSVDIVIYCGDGTDNDDIDFTITKHVDLNDASGTTIALGSAGSGHGYYYKKEHATDVTSVGTWTAVAFSDADGVYTIADPSAQSEGVYVIHIDAADLGDGYSALKFAITDLGSNAKIGCAFALLQGLAAQRAPQNLRSAIA